MLPDLEEGKRYIFYRKKAHNKYTTFKATFVEIYQQSTLIVSMYEENNVVSTGTRSIPITRIKYAKLLPIGIDDTCITINDITLIDIEEYIN